MSNLFDGAVRFLLYFGLLPSDPGVLLLTMLKLSANEMPLDVTLAPPAAAARGLLLPALRNSPTSDALFFRGVGVVVEPVRAPGEAALRAPIELLKLSSFDGCDFFGVFGVEEKKLLTNDFSSSS